MEETKLVLEYFDWCLECWLPFEISNNKTESFASGEAATIVFDYFEKQYKKIKKKELKNIIL